MNKIPYLFLILVFILSFILFLFIIPNNKAYALTDLISGGTATCSSYYDPAPFPCSNSVDKDVSTRWALNNEQGGTWTYDIGSEKKINYFVIDKDNGNTEFTSAYLKGSNNNSTWTDITTLNMNASTTEFFSFTNETEYRYYRLVQLTCDNRGDYICGFDDIWGYYVQPESPAIATSTATSTASLADVSFGLAIIITLLSLGLIGLLFNTLNKKK